MKKKLADVSVIAGNVIGAGLVAMGNPEIAILGYICFLLGNVATLYLLKLSTASRSLLFITYYFLVINVVGIATRMS